MTNPKGAPTTSPSTKPSASARLLLQVNRRLYHPAVGAQHSRPSPKHLRAPVSRHQSIQVILHLKFNPIHLQWIPACHLALKHRRFQASHLHPTASGLRLSSKSPTKNRPPLSFCPLPKPHFTSEKQGGGEKFLGNGQALNPQL